MVKQISWLWRSLDYLWQTSPSQFAELVLLLAAIGSALVVLIQGYVWPFGFLSLLFGMGFSLCWLVRETMMPSVRGAVHRLGAVLCFGFFLSVLIYLAELYFRLYG
jgi:hypothetical protein